MKKTLLIILFVLAVLFGLYFAYNAWLDRVEEGAPFQPEFNDVEEVKPTEYVKHNVSPDIPGYKLFIYEAKEWEANYWNNQKLVLLNKKTGIEQELLKAPGIEKVVWSPNCKRLAASTWMGPQAIDFYLFELKNGELKKISEMCAEAATFVPGESNHAFFYIGKWLDNDRLTAKTSIDFNMEQRSQVEDVYGNIETEGVYTVGQGYKVNEYNWQMSLIVMKPDLPGLDRLKPVVSYGIWDKEYMLYRIDVKGPISASQMKAFVKCFPDKSDTFYAKTFEQYAWDINAGAKGTRGGVSIPTR